MHMRRRLAPLFLALALSRFSIGLRALGGLRLLRLTLLLVVSCSSCLLVVCRLIRMWARPEWLTLTQIKSLALHCMAIRWSALVTRPRTAGEEPSTEAAFVGCVAAPFDWHTAWAGHIGCL
ncbi:hypothetical protein INR49_011862 [Caranx melampygus]|nr:hypothetical protein INR49_011862 [Caranx melampygus]